ncbi:MAG: hypothetical protein K9M98_08210 [Cephaloticoccus sp.]|nr:hypothetical protein [Cephaloticoccus sp.]MCF7760472.1 hypothetical protein [Cephaloticoccus sp.]
MSTSLLEPDLAVTRETAAALMLDWTRLLAPHFGTTGSMDLDRLDWPDAEGPSYYNQFAAHAFLLLAQDTVPGASDVERMHFRRLALRNIEYCLSITDADFHTPHYSRGRDWGRHIGEWLNYYLLCALEIMERDGVGDRELHQRLRTVIAGGTEVLHRRFLVKYAETPAEFVGNHDTWHALLFYRAGVFFQRSDWQDYGREFMRRCVLPFQSPAGYWPEGQGIVVDYNLVTALAVSIYAEISGDRTAHAAIARTIGFTNFFTLPDATTAVVVDVRMRYHDQPSALLPPGFLRSAEGVAMALRKMKRKRVALAQHGVADNGAQALAFFASFAEGLFGSDRPEVLVNDAPVLHLPAARLERNDWVGLLGWQLVPEWGRNRFVLDSQNFLELWHRRAGYLAGGGNSKGMPRFSTVRRTSHGRAYVPDRAEGRRLSAHEAMVEFAYGSDTLVVHLNLSGIGCEIRVHEAQNLSGADYEFALLLAFKPDEIITTSGLGQVVNPGQLMQIREGFTWRDLHWEMPPLAELEYPVVPHNSYTQDSLPNPKDYIARLAFAIRPEPQLVRVF